MLEDARDDANRWNGADEAESRSSVGHNNMLGQVFISGAWLYRRRSDSWGLFGVAILLDARCVFLNEYPAKTRR